jgi:uncharacterized protein YneF (UPF0154 family)
MVQALIAIIYTVSAVCIFFIIKLYIANKKIDEKIRKLNKDR